MRILNARLRDIERRLLAAEGEREGRVTEAEQRQALHGAKLGIFLVLARADIARGQSDAVMDVLDALPSELACSLRERIASRPQGAINVRAEHAAIQHFLPLDEGAERLLDTYQAQGFARWRSETRHGVFFKPKTEEIQA
jgi:hypothetical protein